MIRMTISAFLVFLLALSVQSAIINNNGIFQPIPPGTDDGLYNEGFFEGDIVPRVDVSFFTLFPPELNTIIVVINLQFIRLYR